MRVIAVDQLYQPGVTHYGDTPEYNFIGGLHSLIIPIRHPRSAEIKGVKSGTAEFAFTVMGPVLAFLYRFGDGKTGLPWGDAFYTWHKVPAAEQVPAAVLTGEQRVILQVVLIAAHTGIVKVARAVTLSPEFSQLLHEAIQAQAAAPYPPDYDDQARALLGRYNTHQLLYQARARCIGGAE